MTKLLLGCLVAVGASWTLPYVIGDSRVGWGVLWLIVLCGAAVALSGAVEYVKGGDA